MNHNKATQSHIDLNACKSYATEANLRAAISKLNATYSNAKRPLQYLIARTPEGRWTAIFYGDCQDLLGAGFASIWY